VAERSVDRWLRLLNPERRFARCEEKIASHRYFTVKIHGIDIATRERVPFITVIFALSEGEYETHQRRNEKTRFISVVRRTSYRDIQNKH